MFGAKKEPTVSIREAHNLWDLLSSKYQIMDKTLIYEGIVHDAD